MYYDPYDDDVQVKFHRTDPTGRIVPLDDEDEARADVLEIVGAAASVIVLLCAIGAWWLA